MEPHTQNLRLIESQPFEQALDALQDQNHQESNLAFLSETAEAVASASEQLGTLRGTYDALTGTLFQDANSKLAKSLAKIYAFQFVCNVQLLIGCED
ncbi:hypothetical protein WT08_22100 [Burkholderia sp. MSMB1552]|nr:hypothetical protein WT08_22100 [Burkholderia sp. MSMB1552]KWZ55728.1 hypothetical protein WS92_07255 [Burkholderia sp. MSMB1588]